jgi:hypothetical protein
VVHGVEASADDVSSVYEKLEAAWPNFLYGVTITPASAAAIELPNVFLPAVTSCVDCQNPLGGAEVAEDLTIATANRGRHEFKLAYLHCARCNTYYANVWQVKLYDHRQFLQPSPGAGLEGA